MKLKKIIVCAALGVVLSVSACGAAFATGYKGYTPAKEIVITAPADGYETQAGNISILGACNPNYELYMNGEVVETTESGFFADYVKLEDGKNVFQLKNGSSTKVLTIIKDGASSVAEETTAATETATEERNGKKYQQRWLMITPMQIYMTKHRRPFMAW